MDQSQIRLFFKNQTLFLTGGSGFIGKLLIEKLLRVCDLKKIYILLRPKKGKTAEERFDEFFNFPCFDLLKSQNPTFLEKVSPIFGDCHMPGLGLSDQDTSVLTEEITCVIHAAANVKFDQTLKEASYNVSATRDVVELAKRMKNLKVFVYVSTAFSHCIDIHAEEKFYKPPMKSDQFLTLIEALSDDTLHAITPYFLGEWPNAYVYSKSINEDLLKTVGDHLPVVIVRPAIVCASITEPMAGWIDNLYGPSAIVLGGGLGVIKSLHADPAAAAPLVPVDYVSNFILAAAWKRESLNTTAIYNYAGDKDTQLTWSGFQKHLEPWYWQTVPEKAVWTCNFQMRKNRTWHNIYVFFVNTVPAHMIDFVLFCLGKPTMAVQAFRRLNKVLDLISYFSTKNWSFDYGNVTELWNDMNEADKKLFFFDMKDVDWNRYYRNAAYGGRLYLLKETMDTLPRAHRKVYILTVVHYTITALFFYLLYKIIINLWALF